MDDFWCKSSDDEFNMDDSQYESIDDESLDKRDTLGTFRVMDKEDIQRNQEHDILKVSSALSVSRYAAAILLQKYAWNVKALQDAWVYDEDGTREYVGLLKKPAAGLQKSGESSVCGTCFEKYVFDKRFENTVGFCGHRFCTACLETYVSKAIDDGPACLFLQCPDSNCRAVIGQDRVNMLVSDEGKIKYKEYFLKSYLKDHKFVKWCPAPDCECAIHYLGGVSYDVTCRCLSNFCWNCLEEAHSPVDCETAAKWMYSSESENVTWILANTQPCPKCKVLIEKNGVCCKFVRCVCGYKFCWTCLGSSITGYECIACANDKDFVKHDENAKERVRNRFKGCNMRYVYYFEKWDANHKAQEKELVDLCNIRENLVAVLEKKHCCKPGGFNFITEAWKQIVECRRLLKWMYVYGYYIPEEAYSKTTLFEYLQGEAEIAFKSLHDCAENTLNLCLKVDDTTNKFETLEVQLIDRTAVTRKHFKNFLQGVSDGLPEVEGNPRSEWGW